VVTVWENIPFLHNSSATERIKSEVFKATDLFLAVSNRAKEALILEGAPEHKIIVQMLGIDTNRFRPMEKDTQLLHQFGCGADDLIILFAASLYREKGVFDLLCGFRRLLDRFGKDAKLKLLIVGKGREETYVLRAINNCTLKNMRN
jgi:glycosyltransferase involved in cell wall biosynthesis